MTRRCLLLLCIVAVLIGTNVSRAQTALRRGDSIGFLDGWANIPARYNPGAPAQPSAGDLGRDGYEYQCVELIRRFYREAKGVNTATDPWCCGGADGRAFFPRATAGLLDQGSFRFVVHVNGSSTSPPAVEDIVGFDETTVPKNPHGHVALVKRVTARPDGALDVEILEQNVPITANRVLRAERLPGGTYLLSGRQNIQGWIRLATGPVSANVELTGGVFTPSAGTALAINPMVSGQPVSRVEIVGPPTWNGGLPFVIPNIRFQPPGTAPQRAFWWDFISPVAGTYRASVTAGGQSIQRDFAVSLAPQLARPVFTAFSVDAANVVSMTWTAPADARSFMVRVNRVPWPGFAVQDIVVSGTTRHFAFTGLALAHGAQYQAVVFAFSHDLRKPDPLTSPFNVSESTVFFVGR